MIRQLCENHKVLRWAHGAVVSHCLTFDKQNFKLGKLTDLCKTYGIILVRATPKSNSVDNMRALQGNATVLEDAIKL